MKNFVHWGALQSRKAISDLFSFFLYTLYLVRSIKSTAEPFLHLNFCFDVVTPPKSPQTCCTHPKTPSCNKSFSILQQTYYNKPISGCVRISSYSLLKTSLLQVVNRLAWIFTDLLQLVVSTSCSKCTNEKVQQAPFQQSYFTWWNWQVYCQLMASCDKAIKLGGGGGVNIQIFVSYPTNLF